MNFPSPPGPDPDAGTGPGTVPPGSCHRYAPGHHVHWDQARQCHEDPGELHEVLVSADDVQDDGWVTLHEAGDRFGHSFRAWHHRAGQLRAKLRGHRGPALWQPRWNLLWFPAPESPANTLLYLAPDGPSNC
ncbi:hypothetical protein [Streptomyces sp. NPDC048442]|uniref:hypothetical protein n=1 Tax=Streptomyces sp. NPDC048442 TaxID=3154823 RepID=UPI0034466733